jgi:hypothetical protein
MLLQFHAHSRRRRRFGPLAVLVLVALMALAVVALRSHGGSADESAPLTSPEGASGATKESVRFPAAPQVRSARLFAAKRSGLVSFAVVDTSGTRACYRCRVSYHSASVVKAMLLVAYLNGLADAHQSLPSSHEAYLDSMIRVSDNAAATVIYAHVGDRRLYELAAEAQMDDFRISGSWGSARITAADQSRFFTRMQELTAAEYQGYVRDLLSSIVPRESWGIPEVSRPEWRTYFKGGWLTSRRGSLVHQVARLEKGHLSLTIAILTDGNPSDVYGRETVRGIAERLLAR